MADKPSAGLGATLSLSAIVAAVKGFWSGEHDPARIAITASCVALIGLLAIAIAMIVSSDLRARQVGAEAMYQARAQIATTFMRLARQVPLAQHAVAPDAAQPSQLITLLLAAIGQPGDRQIHVTLAGGQPGGTVTGLKYNPADHGQIRVEGEWVDLNLVESFVTL